jgi:hypothetical protein
MLLGRSKVVEVGRGPGGLAEVGENAAGRQRLEAPGE